MIDPIVLRKFVNFAPCYVALIRCSEDQTSHGCLPGTITKLTFRNLPLSGYKHRYPCLYRRVGRLCLRLHGSGPTASNACRNPDLTFSISGHSRCSASAPTKNEISIVLSYPQKQTCLLLSSKLRLAFGKLSLIVCYLSAAPHNHYRPDSYP